MSCCDLKGGCYETDVSQSGEDADCFIDNVVIQGAETITDYSWKNIGNHSDGSSYVWSFDGIWDLWVDGRVGRQWGDTN